MYVEDHAVWLSTHHRSSVHINTFKTQITRFQYSFVRLQACISIVFSKSLIFFQPFRRLNPIYNAIYICVTVLNVQDKRWATHSPRPKSLLNLEDVDLACVFQRLSPVAEPYSHNLSVIVQLSGDFSNLLTRGQRVLLKVGVEHLYRLRCETGASLAFFRRFTANKLHQILLALLVPVLGFGQPLLQHRLQLLSALRGDIQLFKPAVREKFKSEVFHWVLFISQFSSCGDRYNQHRSNLKASKMDIFHIGLSFSQSIDKCFIIWLDLTTDHCCSY